MKPCMSDSAVQPGRVYEDQSGNRYLVLTNCQFRVNLNWYENTARPDTPTDQISAVHCRPDMFGKHYYLPWTKDLANEVGRDTSLANIIKTLAKKDATSPIVDRITVTMEPKKFVKETAKLFDPKALRPAVITGSRYIVDGIPRDNVYKILSAY